jgi:zinc/manganese transport system ATP-binding protein
MQPALSASVASCPASPAKPALPAFALRGMPNAERVLAAARPLSVTEKLSFVADVLGLWGETGAFRSIGRAGRARAVAALAAVGLDGFAARPVGSLSAGQFQRVLFARQLLQDAPVILLDEPFNALDARTAADLLAMVHRWHGEGRTVIAVLHDLELVRREFPETLLLARDCLGWGPTDQVLTAANRLRARMMAEAWSAEPEACDRQDAA